MTASKDLNAAIERLRGYVDNGGLIHTASAYRTSDGRVHLIEFDDLRAVLDAAAESGRCRRPYSDAVDTEHGAWETDDIEERAHDLLAVVRHRRSDVTDHTNGDRDA